MRIHIFIDGAYLLNECAAASRPWPDPVNLRRYAADLFRGFHGQQQLGSVTRVSFYDALREGKEHTVRQSYWEAFEALPDCEVKHGFLKRTRRSGEKQVGVDVQLAVDLVVGAHTDVFDVAILVAGDDDFFPAVYEARRRGVSVGLMSFRRSLGAELRRAADRVLLLEQAHLTDLRSLIADAPPSMDVSAGPSE